MLKWILLLAALLMVGCNSTGPEAESKKGISPGVYNGAIQFQTTPPITATAEDNFKDDGTFIGRIYINNGTLSCMIVDGSSTWTSTATSYTIAAASIKSRSDCGSDWASEDRPSEVTQIRNVTASSYEEYVEMNSQPAIWVKFNKI